MTQPSIDVLNITSVDSETSNVTFRLLGCNIVNDLKVRFSLSANLLDLSQASTPCSQLSELNAHTPPQFSFLLKNSDTFTIEAIVDQHYSQVYNRSDILPAELAGSPQLHLSKMRLQKEYQAVSVDGKRRLKGGRVIKYEKQQCKKRSLVIKFIDFNQMENQTQTTGTFKSLTCQLQSTNMNGKTSKPFVDFS